MSIVHENKQAEQPNAELLDALMHLETALETPFVPGELEAWVTALNTAAKNVSPLLKHQIATVHAAEIKQIESEDKEMLQRVDDLRKTDADNLECLEKLSRAAGTLKEMALKIEPDETRFKEQLDDLVEDGLRFVICVRKQEVGLKTWLWEALARDRGVGD